MTTKVPTVKFNNGIEIPIIGLGTWLSKPGQVYEAVKYAIEIGYRHFDCAWLYGNENEIGQALKESIDSGKVKREELFITSKVWNTYHKTDNVHVCLEKTLKALKLDYLDLYLIHWPMGYKEGDELFPIDEDKNVLTSDIDYLETWKGMEQAYEHGKVKSIGVSNFNHKQLQRLLENCKIKPVNNQVECHPYLNQSKLIEFCRQNQIVVSAYSPLGSPGRPTFKSNDPILMENEKLKRIANSYGKNVAQILIRYQIQRKVVVIPKSVTPKRIKENFDVFDFQLTDEEMKIIDSFDDKNQHFRYCTLIETGVFVLKHKYYPFNEEF